MAPVQASCRHVALHVEAFVQSMPLHEKAHCTSHGPVPQRTSPQLLPRAQRTVQLVAVEQSTSSSPPPERAGTSTTQPSPAGHRQGASVQVSSHTPARQARHSPGHPASTPESLNPGPASRPASLPVSGTQATPANTSTDTNTPLRFISTA